MCRLTGRRKARASRPSTRSRERPEARFDCKVGCAVHRALVSPRLVLGAQPSLDVRNQRLAFLGAHPPNSLAPAALELPISPRYQVPWRVEFRAHLRPRRGLRDRRYRGGGVQSRSGAGRELTGKGRLRPQSYFRLLHQHFWCLVEGAASRSIATDQPHLPFGCGAPLSRRDLPQYGPRR